MKELINDLIEEQVIVDQLVNKLDEAQWQIDVPVEKWNIKDTIIHLTFFDYCARKLLLGESTNLLEITPESEPDEYVRATKFRHLSGKEVLSWWREERTKVTNAFYHKDPKDRVPWAPGYPMSSKSLLSARLMELWAHSVDIYDALGLEPIVEDRITTTLFLSWQSRPFAYKINNLDTSNIPIYLELELPSGKIWANGDFNADNYIKGSAKEWALVSIRRRNWMDTDLEVVGEEARRYASVVQTFAGPPEKAPEPKRYR